MLWASNGLNVPTGYGVPTKYVTRYLADRGHKMAVQAFYGVQGGMIQAGDITIYPAQAEPYGIDVIGQHAKHFGADLVVTLIDNWILPVDYNDRFEAPWLSWFPVDGTPAPAACVMMARKADYPAPFSRDGVEELAKAGVESHYLPYGIDCDLFKPGDKALARKELNLPADAYIVTTVGANRGFPARKAWPEIMMGFKMFAEDHPDALLYLHTRKVPFAEKGVYMEPLVADLELESRVIFTDPAVLSVGCPNENLVPLYQASDVMLLPSMGEGFGLPIAEAQACGCPVITQACSSMTELTVNGVALTPAQPFWASGLNYWWQMPSIHEINRGLRHLYDDSESHRVFKAVEGIEHFRENYHWPVVMERHWMPLLDRVEGELW